MRSGSNLWTMKEDNFVICGKSRELVEENLKSWRYFLERRRMKVSCCKTEYETWVNEREGVER